MEQKTMYSIAARLFAAIVAVSLLVTLIASGVHIYFYSQDYQEELERDFSKISNSFVPSLAASLWVMDMNQTQVLLDGLLNDPCFQHLKIEGKDGTIVSAGSLNTDKFIHRQFPLAYAYNGRQVDLGVLHAYSLEKPLRTILMEQGLTPLIYQAFQTFLVAFIIFYMVRQFITKHLSVLADHLIRLKPAKNHDPIALKRSWTISGRPDELDQMVDSINKMEERLHSAFHELEKELEARERAEEALRQSNQRYQILVETIPYGLQEIDAEGLILFDNDFHHRMLGYGAGELIGMSIFDFTRQEEHASLRNYLAFLVLEQPPPTPYFARDIKKNGELIDVRVDWDYKRDSQGNVVGFISILTDITEQKRAENALKESEERFRRLAENAKDMIYRMSLPEGTYEYVSPAATDICGYSPEEFYQSTGLIEKIIHPDWLGCFREQWTNLLEGDMPPFYEYQITDKSGETKWINQRNVLIRDNAGRPIAMEGIVTDITVRKRTEKALRESEERIRQIAEASPDYIMQLDLDFAIQYINRVEPGFSKRDLIGTHLYTFAGEGEQSSVKECFETVVRTGKPMSYETHLTDKDGNTKYFESIASPIIIGDTPSGLIVVSRDFTRRLQMEEALRQSESMLRAAIDSLPFDFFMLTEAGRYTVQNRSCISHWGDFIGKSPEDSAPDPKTLALWESNNRRALAGETVSEEVTFEQMGETRTFHNIISPVRDGEQIIGILGMNIDITERKMAEKALRESEERFRELAENIREVFWLFDLTENQVIYASPAYEEIWGRPVAALYGRYQEWTESIHPHDITYARESFAEIIETGGGGERIYRIIRPDGETRWIADRGFLIKDEAGRPYRIAGIAEDITPRKLAEEVLKNAHGLLEKKVAERTSEFEKTYKQLLHVEKLAAVGHLSASIAHEFNNPLYGVMNILSGIKRRAPLDREDAELVEMALTECLRMKNLIKDLQDFNRPSSGKFTRINVHSIINSVILLCKKDFNARGITVRKQYVDAVPEIKAVADQIKQVILNILANAADACEEGGKITIRTERDRKHALVSVQDSGRGIQPDNMKHIFEPFFTTKPEVKGTGLGLSVSYGIIKNHGGDILVESEAGKGSTFTIKLPIEDVNNEA